MRFAVTSDGKLARWLEHLDGNLSRATTNGTKRILLSISVAIMDRIRSRADLTPRSGGLGKSWNPRVSAKVQVTPTGSGAVGTLGSDHPAARIQNDGGTVKPVTANMLSIPLEPAKTPAGVSKYASPRQVPDLFVITSKKGNVLLVKRSKNKVRYMVDTVRDKRGRFRAGGKARSVSGLRYGIEPWFLLVKQVNLPATKYIDHSIEDASPKFAETMDRAIQEEIGKRLLT